MHGPFDGGFRHAQVLTQLRVGASARFARLVVLQNIEQNGLPKCDVLLAQPVHGGLQDLLGPTAIKNLNGRKFIHRLEEIARFANRLVQRNELAPPAPLLRTAPPALFQQKVFDVRQQERPEFALLMMQLLKILPGEQAREKLLGQVLGFRRIVSIAPDISVKRRPIRAAQLLQCLVGLLRVTGPGRLHDTPVRRDKPRRCGRCWRGDRQRQKLPVFGSLTIR